MSERAWHRSLYWRIALGFILFLAVVLVAQGALFFYVIARAEGALPARSLLDLATLVAADLGSAFEHDAGLDVEQHVRRRYGDLRQRVFVIGPDGRLLAANHDAEPDAGVWRLVREWEARGAPREVEAGGLWTGGRAVALTHIVAHGRPAGVVVVQPGRPSLRVLAELGPLMSAVALALTIGATILAALLIFGPAHRRLEGLEDAARRFGAGDAGARAPEGGRDEIAAVAHAFNTMAEELAGRAAALQASDRARRQLLADVSHELMTPLTAIRGYVETLGMAEREIDAETRTRYLGIIERETLRLEGIVGDLLDLARLEAGGGTLRLETVSVADLFGRIVSRHERETTAMAIRVAVHVDPAGATVRADPGRLEQALENLAANALRHSHEGGDLELRARHAGDAIVLTVRDTGEGIPPEHLPLIFDRFYKADASRTAGRTSRSGLGLSIVKAIVERHGGRIDVTSQPGAGTAFDIRLPVAFNPGAPSPV